MAYKKRVVFCNRFCQSMHSIDASIINMLEISMRCFEGDFTKKGIDDNEDESIRYGVVMCCWRCGNA